MGIMSLSIPIYLSETIHPSVRGTLGIMPTTFANFAIVLCFVLAAYLDWVKLAWVGSVIPIPFIALMTLIPESPIWYILKRNEKGAKESLQFLRGSHTDVEPELHSMICSFAASQRRSTIKPLENLSKLDSMKPLLISLGLMFFRQFCGINGLIFYTVQIFRDAGSSIDENLCTIIVALVNLMSSFIATMLIDLVGRKVLLFISSAVMSITLMILGSFFYYKDAGHDTSSLVWLPLASFIVYVFGYSLGLGPVPWLMMGEMLPSKVRDLAGSIVTSFNWLCVFIVTRSFADIISESLNFIAMRLIHLTSLFLEIFGNHGVFWFFGCICILSTFYSIQVVPETQRKSLDEIHILIMGKRAQTGKYYKSCKIIF